MPDREKVMSWLEGLAQPDWRKFHSDTEVQVIAESALALLKEQEEQVISWTKQIAKMQRVHAPAGWQSKDQRMYNKGVWDGLQIAWNIISEGR